ncbi:MAG: PSD1 and planctomycete cytochrome C domain-containing protein [Pirellulaceae bacterium]|jgi:hypothetical protein|nr:PSD1 and planctomycete cytochrome C domain-containing protein [Pirellulaceae bacterium]MDP7016104.1 PSD1 and planctomycete cytochrome C domain-containing protein [Pirellulaceae bacterium]
MKTPASCRIVAATVCCLLMLSASVDADEFSAVSKIFAERCLRCHNDVDHKGDFSLQTKKALFDSGYVERGDPAASGLLDALLPQDGQPPTMPKKAKPLTAAEVATVRRWIAAGASWPASRVIVAPEIRDFDWWSLKPIQRTDTPELSAEEAAWSANEIDRFLIAKLRDKGLRPSPPADRRTLIRRVYYDLIGLPPDPEEVERFLADDDPLAYEKLVDRLLASPRYGERWARHWLDVVHYGDTHGYDKDKLRLNAWPYRDYVIRCFNDDKSYARFVREQLAGDKLYPHTVDGVVATGFIAAGPWDFIGHAEVPETKIDGQVARNLDRDNMVTSTMNTFCSVTVQCARCHNHKIDPLTMLDYYRLQAVFAAVDRADRPYDESPESAARRREITQRQELLARQLKEVEERIESRKTPAVRKLENQLAAMRKAADRKSKATTPRSFAYGYHSQVAAKQNTTKWVQLDLGRVVALDELLLFGADEYGWADFGFPHRFRVEGATDANLEDSVLLADYSDADFPRPGRSPVRIAGQGKRVRYLRVTALSLWNRRQRDKPLSKDWIFAIGEAAAVANGVELPVKRVTSLDSIEAMPRWGRANIADGVLGSHSLDDVAGGAQASKTNGYHSQFSPRSETTKWIELNLASVRKVDQLVVVPAFPTDWKDTPGFGFPLRFQIEVASKADRSDARVVFDRSKADFPPPLNRRLVVDMGGSEARYVRLTASKLWKRDATGHALAVAEMQVWSDGENLARQSQVAASDSIESGRWSKKFAVDGFSSRNASPAHGSALAELFSEGDARAKIASLQRELSRQLSDAAGKRLVEERAAIKKDQAKATAELSALPKPGMVYAGTVHNGTGAFRGRHGLGPRPIFILHRGEVTKPGAPVQPGVAPLIEGAAPVFDLPADHDEGSRRAALADWITRADNPLTWRSIVNRVWQYHFGRGLVESPNDFGRGGELPTHPELLDWLATYFHDSGGSFKQLHRLIVTTSAYRQSSRSDNARAAIDAGNQFLWRMNRRRLTAEEIRDASLLAAGRLNYSMGGPGYQDFVIEHPQHSPHFEYTKHDANDPRTHRRAVYRFIVRSQPQPFMNTLDCADPSMSVPRRDETLTSLQALALLNNRFMVAMSQHFATRLGSEASDAEARLERAFQLGLSRSPTKGERAALLAYADRHGWENVCRLILNLNEFVFVD